MVGRPPGDRRYSWTLCAICACGLLECALICAARADWGRAGRAKPRAVCEQLAAGAPPRPATVFPGRDKRLALATSYDLAYKALARVSVQNKRAYAMRHGLSLFVLGPASLACDRPASWSKVLAVKAALDAGHEWAMWMDADAVFANLSATLDDAAHAHVSRAMRSPRTWLVLSRDAASGSRINNGVFLLRRGANADAFLAAVWNATLFLSDTPGVRNSRHGDQRAFEHALDAMGSPSEPPTRRALTRLKRTDAPVAYVPQREINSYPATYAPGDLVVHIAGCLAGARRTRAQCAAELARWAAVDDAMVG
ncbi:hypothetical protein KFE25_013400 [Diacronema lutheri]|uniref:Nucleotide-diphospho-sugar transferase domain-containing protein n=2 Tax=Diacronema lutheri TaxID=2081491 RepID=A0A8J5XTW2_DIALT|nr:hypothetical protein KFE25_013400 [Diacronema lutheri]